MQLGGLYIPLFSVVVTMLLWNYTRTGHPFITTGAQTAAVYTLAQLEKNGTRVFYDDTPLDHAARKHLQKYDFVEGLAINGDLARDQRLSAPEIAELAAKKYARVWVENPKAMLSYTWDNIQKTRYVMFSTAVGKRLGNSPFYEFLSVNLYLLCTVALPLSFIISSWFFRFVRPYLWLVLSLSIFIAGSILMYAVMSMEARYVLVTITPALLIFTLAVRACRGLPALGSGRRWDTVPSAMGNASPLVQHYRSHGKLQPEDPAARDRSACSLGELGRKETCPDWPKLV
jgi:hypothetical protein